MTEDERKAAAAHKAARDHGDTVLVGCVLGAAFLLVSPFLVAGLALYYWWALRTIVGWFK